MRILDITGIGRAAGGLTRRETVEAVLADAHLHPKIAAWSVTWSAIRETADDAEIRAFLETEAIARWPRKARVRGDQTRSKFDEDR